MKSISSNSFGPGSWHMSIKCLWLVKKKKKGEYVSG
jgi:hypothetical protein